MMSASELPTSGFTSILITIWTVLITRRRGWFRPNYGSRAVLLHRRGLLTTAIRCQLSILVITSHRFASNVYFLDSARSGKARSGNFRSGKARSDNFRSGKARSGMESWMSREVFCGIKVTCPLVNGWCITCLQIWLSNRYLSTLARMVTDPNLNLWR